MSLRFVVISEARADFVTATELADRVFREQIAWLEESGIEHQRQWVGEFPAGSQLAWDSIPGRAREIGIRVHGHFNSDPGLPDAHAARRAIAYVRRVLPRVDAIILIRDVDRQPARRDGLNQARAVDTSKHVIAIGVAIIERESWVVSGFQSENSAESERHKAEIKTLGFDPCLMSHRLTADKDENAIKSPKRVLSSLVGTDWERQRNCWTVTPLQILRERGTDNGLKDFLSEIANRLIPLITGHQRPESQ